jgi:hypothetical protein
MGAKFWLKACRDDHSETQGTGGRIILKWILGKQDGRM